MSKTIIQEGGVRVRVPDSFQPPGDEPASGKAKPASGKAKAKPDERKAADTSGTTSGQDDKA